MSTNKSEAVEVVAPAAAIPVQRLAWTTRVLSVLHRRTREAYELSDSSARLRPMEGLRGLAVALVFFVHFHALFGDYVRDVRAFWRTSAFLGTVGNSGVDLFFVLSGYLIYGALVRHRTTLATFLARRATRIYPAFLATFALYLGLSLVFPANSKLHGHLPFGLAVYLLQNLFLLPGIFPIVPIITVAWSLSYEAAFYVSTAVFIFCIRLWMWTRRARVALVTSVLISYIAICFSLPQAHVRALMFLVGILLFEALSIPVFQALFSGRGESIAIAVFVLSLAYSYLLDIRPDLFLLLPGWTAGRSFLAGVPGYQGPYKTIVLGFSMFWFVGYSFAGKGRLKQLFSVAPVRYLGNMSYSYYLIHGLTLQGVSIFCAHFWPPNSPNIIAFVSALFLGFAATWTAATVLFLFVEKPFSLQPHASPERRINRAAFASHD